MNLKIIQTPDYILGVDKEAILHDEDIHISPIREGIMNTFIIDNKVGNDNYKSRPLDRKDCWKVIAHILLNGNKSLEGVWLLPEIEDKEDKLVELSMTSHGLGDTYEGRCFESGFQLGYKAAGGYTEEDMKKAFMQGMKGEGCTALYIHFEEFIQSLKPFPIEFEVEMEEYGYEPVIGKFPNYEVNPSPKLFRPKILNNIIQGKYIWKQLN